MDIGTLAQALSRLTPENMSVSSGFINDFQTPLKMDEFALSENASRGRKAEFVAGRNCLRKAITAFYDKTFTIGRSEDGKPILPPGVVGSLSHKYPFVVSIAASNNEYCSLGVDIETIDNWSEKPSPVFVNSSDLALHEHIDAPFNEYCSILFSAKESAYKALKHAKSDTSLNIRNISPGLRQLAKDTYEYSVLNGDIICHGRLLLTRPWVIAACWITHNV
ncbi:4'-phosphopantetheinyl transferase family protein [Rheinheimera sp. MM224]|uniref:4'-phosphopantetheinyl transferase family protein n=1 Tax=Rheinheimera sp. MM224 TaxID=3019969 RepID=UPI0021F85666|nr:4'-phosphopantetheinyl transferase superfamily protein [Rheinheimera sp. MM224]CAI3805424.1 hypothetical protein JAMGFMIE_03869 [Rheinheimera sp. MM224]